MSSTNETDKNGENSPFRIPNNKGRGRSQSASSTGSQPRHSRSPSMSKLSDKKELAEGTAVFEDENPAESSEVTAANATEDNGNATSFQEIESAGINNPADEPMNPMNPDAGDTFKSSEFDIATEVEEVDMKAKVEAFLKGEWTNPAETLEKSITEMITSWTTFDGVAMDWVMEAGELFPDDVISLTHDAYPQANLKAMKDLAATVFGETTEPTDEPALPAWEQDVGFKLMDQHGNSYVQSLLAETVLRINDKIISDPGEKALKKICLPVPEQDKTLIFQTSYLYPEHSYTYAIITVSRWSSNWNNQGSFLEKLGVIIVPMIKCQDKEPELDILMATQAASLLGVDACETNAVRYTVTGTPRFHPTEYSAHITDGPIREGLDKLSSLIDGTTKVKIDFVHPIYEKTDDLSQDHTVMVLECVTEGWHRDAKDPLAIWFAKSPSKHMMDIGTVPKGDLIPFMDQVPALAVFDSDEQYNVTMTMGNQTEKEFHDRQNGKLHDCELNVRFIPDRKTLHPKTKAPQVLFMLINSSSVGPDADYLLPRVGDSAKITLKGISTKPQTIGVIKDMGEVDNEHIASHIKDTIRQVNGDMTLQDKSESDDKLHDLLKILCVRDEQGNDIEANIKKLRDSIQEIRGVAKDAEELAAYVKSNRTWLAPPPPEMDEDNVLGDPIRLHGHRINVPSKLWPVHIHVWTLRVPVDKNTLSEKAPLILDLPDPTADEEGKLLSVGSFKQRCTLSQTEVTVKIDVVDSDKTFKAEMNAIKKLMHGHTMPLDDRPSLVSVNAMKDLIAAKLRDGMALKDILKPLEKLRLGTHESKGLQNMYNSLSKDKHGAVKFLLDDKKLIKYIHGPPGTGKTHLAIFLICVMLASDPPTTGIDDDWDRPLDFGPRVEIEDYDKVDRSKPLAPVQLTDEQQATLSSRPKKVSILVVSGQNTAVDDLTERIMPMWKQFGGEKLCNGQRLHRDSKPVALRMYSWDSEARDFVPRFAKVGRDIKRTDEDNTGGILMTLLGAFSDQAHEYDREGRRFKSSNVSVVDMAEQLYLEDRKLPAAQRKYTDLADNVEKVKANPAHMLTLGKVITRLVKTGPQTDAILKADVICATPIGAADRTFRKNFRPDYIISDESPRDKEIAFLILLAHFSPRAIFCFGDHNQLRPVIFSKYQHLKYKPPRSFKRTGVEESAITEPAVDNEPGQDNDGFDDVNADTNVGVADWDKQDATDKEKQDATDKNKQDATDKNKQDGTDKEKQDGTDKNKQDAADKEKQDAADKNKQDGDESKDVPKKEEALPKPSTFANQLETSLIHRLMQAGHPTYMLRENWRQHGTSGEFFNKQFYGNKLKFREKGERFDQMDKAAILWLDRLIKELGGVDKTKAKGNTLMINMNSFESCESRSFLNVGNVNFVLSKVAELLADPNFSPATKKDSNGKVLIIAPYVAQRNLYTHELQKRRGFELTTKGDWIAFDKSRIEIRTHQGAQGYEASVVVVDLTRSEAPGMTGQSKVIAVSSSRSICAQLVLINTQMLDRLESKNSPTVRNLVAWVQFHQEKDMLVSMDFETAKQFRTTCNKCYGFGHKVAECPCNKRKSLI